MEERIQTPIVNITGYSGSGKTTFIERYIPLLRESGYVPAYIKHSGHFHSFDLPGKDTFRQFQAGAQYSASRLMFEAQSSLSAIFKQTPPKMFKAL